MCIQMVIVLEWNITNMIIYLARKSTGHILILYRLVQKTTLPNERTCPFNNFTVTDNDPDLYTYNGP